MNGLRLVLAALLLAGCAGQQLQGDPGAPVLVEGRVVDENGAPVPGAKLKLIAYDPLNPATGKAALIVFEGTYVAGSDGSFTLRLAPTDPLSHQALTHDGKIVFELRSDGESAITEVDPIPTFSRVLLAGQWIGAPPKIEIRPSGAPVGGAAVPIAVAVAV